MPRINTGTTQVPKTWQQIIVEQIKAGRAVPVLSNSIGNELLLENYWELISRYALHTKYPLLEIGNLAHITQFVSVMEVQAKGDMGTAVAKKSYLQFIKSRLLELAESNGVDRGLLNDTEAEFDNLDFSKLAEQLGYPRFSHAAQDPLLILAGMNLPIYLTTGYHTLLEVALRRAGKEPHTGVCRWCKPLEKDIPDVFAEGYQPSTQEPLVYHLLGLDEYPDSLVLTEDEHLEFLVAVAQEMGRPEDRIPARIREALTRSSPLLLGYDLRSWEFRTLFWGLLKPRESRKQGVSVLHLQLNPCKAECQYLKIYLDKADFEIFWGDIYEYTRELHKELSV